MRLWKHKARATVRLALLGAISTAILPPAAWACPACFQASSPGAALGFYLSTALLSLMPVAIVAALVLYLRRRIS